MENDFFERVRRVNYWDDKPKSIGFVRDYYVNQIFEYMDNHLLKVLVGQRRSGKSYILKQVIHHLINNGTPPENIFYLNFELHDLHFIKNVEVLTDIVESYRLKLNPTGKCYLFFDEIQEIQDWERLINSLLANERFDVEIFLTGSNAHLLSTELSTYVTGRYVEIPVYPFSFQEYAQFKSIDSSRADLIQFLESSGIPELFFLKNKSQKVSYLMALTDSILMNDIVKRFNIKNPKLLILLLDFIIDTTAHLLSIRSIVNKLQSCGITLNAVTVGNYIHYLEMTFLVHGVSRYDIKGKKILEGERKYYLNDLGYYNYLKNTFEGGINKKLENHVYLVLLQLGFRVYVGNIYQLEIDFVAEKEQQLVYIQVAYLLHSEEVVAREFGNLEKVKDNWPKWVVSLDEVSFPAKNGVLHVPAWELVEKLKQL